MTVRWLFAYAASRALIICTFYAGIYMTGWIKLHKKLLDWEWYNDHNTFRLFTYLLLKANYEKKNWRGIVIERGQLITSLQSLSIETGISIQSLRTSLIKLKSTGELTDVSTGQSRLLTIVKYSDYQITDMEPTGNQQAINRPSTSKSTGNQQGNQQAINRVINRESTGLNHSLPIVKHSDYSPLNFLSTGNQQGNQQAINRVINRESTGKSTTTKETKKKEKKDKKDKKDIYINFLLPEWLPETDWNNFITQRNEKEKTKVSIAAYGQLLKKLELLKSQGENPSAVLQQSINNNYLGLFPEKKDFRNDGFNNNKRQPTAHDNFAAGAFDFAIEQ